MSEQQECGFTYDHDIEITHEDQDGYLTWVCRRCGGEGWEEP